MGVTTQLKSLVQWTGPGPPRLYQKSGLSLTICSVFFFEKADEFVAKKIHRYTEFAAKFMFSVGKVHAVSHSRTRVSVNSTVSLALA